MDRPRETDNRGWETRKREVVRQGTKDVKQEQRSETGNRGWITMNIDDKQVTEDG